MEERTRGMSMQLLEKHLCGIMVIFLFFGERLQFLGIPYYAYAMIAYAVARLRSNHFKINVHGFGKLSFANSGSFAVFWLVVATIMLPFSMRIAGTRPYTYALITCLTILIITLSIENDDDLYLIMKYAMIGVLITLIVTGYEIYTGNHLYRFDEYYTRLGRNSAFGFQVNPNDHATVLVTCVFIVIFFIRKHKVISTALIAMTVALTMRTGARLAVYTLFVIGIEVLVLALVSRLSARRAGVSKFINVFIFVFLGIALLMSFSVDRFLQMFSSSQEYLIDYNRFILMGRAFGTISPLSFLLGNGSGVTMVRIGNVNIHSVLVEILCDNGILVLVWLMYLVGRLFFSYTDDISKGKRILFPCFATAFVLLCFESSSMMRIHPIWMMLAVMLKVYLLEINRSATDESVDAYS